MYLPSLKKFRNYCRVRSQVGGQVCCISLPQVLPQFRTDSRRVPGNLAFTMGAFNLNLFSFPALILPPNRIYPMFQQSLFLLVFKHSVLHPIPIQSTYIKIHSNGKRLEQSTEAIPDSKHLIRSVQSRKNLELICNTSTSNKSPKTVV